MRDMEFRLMHLLCPGRSARHCVFHNYFVKFIREYATIEYLKRVPARARNNARSGI